MLHYYIDQTFLATFHSDLDLGVVWLVEVCGHRFVQLFVVMSDRRPFILMSRVFSVSLAYCMLHLLQLIRYTMFFVLHVNWLSDGVFPACGVTGKSIGTIY